jgi:hypothetical protein
VACGNKAAAVCLERAVKNLSLDRMLSKVEQGVDLAKRERELKLVYDRFLLLEDLEAAEVKISPWFILYSRYYEPLSLH